MGEKISTKNYFFLNREKNISKKIIIKKTKQKTNEEPAAKVSAHSRLGEFVRGPASPRGHNENNKKGNKIK